MLPHIMYYVQYELCMLMLTARLSFISLSSCLCALEVELKDSLFLSNGYYIG